MYRERRKTPFPGNRQVFLAVGRQHENKPMTRTRILVVEDESLVRELMVEVLTEAGFEVDDADSADEADKLLDIDGYKLLVTDIHMPGKLDGMELAQRSLKRKPGLPILFITARPDVLERLRTPTSIVSNIAKPFDLARMVAAVRQLIEDSDI
jgi:DNA-binding response OmpR family regulator